jgi:predicted flap endonuclease-1-like 5' DNA nuclease
MSYMTSPLSLVFDFQRTAIEQTHDAVTRGVELQQDVSADLTDFESVKETNDRSYELVHSFVDSYFDALESTLPGQEEEIDDLRERVTEGVDDFEDLQDEVIETLEENTGDRQAFADDVREEFLHMVDERVEALLDAHADFERETLDATEDLEGSLEDQLDRFEEQLDDLRERLTDLSEEIGERTEAVTVEIEDVGEELEAIKGIGPAYAQRLREHGITTFDDLAAASVETVAEAAEVPASRAESWIDAAKASA